jgi:hypothetical protein
MCQPAVPFAERQGPPRPTVGALARAHGAALLREHALSEAQRKVLHAISICRTSVLGGRVDVCPTPGCGYERVVFHSCRNRHCPSCQALNQARWVERRRERLLPTAYFHVVFTVPDALLTPIALRNRALFYNALFDAGSETLLALGKDPDRLGAQLAITAVLHTWTRDLRFHPHLHCIVTGGGLTDDALEWKSTRQDYLFPVSVLSDLFRGKLLAKLDDARDAGKLKLAGIEGFENPKRSDGAWHKLRKLLCEKPWVSYAKPPFGGAAEVYAYLGRYTHRVGISNHRLLSATDDAVTFRTRDDKTATLDPVTFLHRFLQHVLPDRFVKLRHYGLLASSNVNGRLQTAKLLLEAQPLNDDDAPTPEQPAQLLPVDDWPALLLRLTGLDLSRCPRCGAPLTSLALDRPRAQDTS